MIRTRPRSFRIGNQPDRHGWTHDLGTESEVSVQTYDDLADRGFGLGREIRDTVDFVAQQRFPVGDRN